MTDSEVLELLQTTPITQVAKTSGRTVSSIYVLFTDTYPGQRLSRQRLSLEHRLAVSGKGIDRILEMKKLKEENGKSNTEIGLLQKPPISRQRVDQLLAMLRRKAKRKR